MATVRTRFESEAFKQLLSKGGEHDQAFLATGQKQGSGRTMDWWNRRGRANGGELDHGRVSDRKSSGGGGGTDDVVPERGRKTFCFKCKIIRNCPKQYCQGCGVQGHYVTECRKLDDNAVMAMTGTGEEEESPIGSEAECEAF